MVGTTEGILGLNPEAEGLVIDPSIPSEWKSFTMEKKFRGKQLNITVNNPNGSQHGVKKVTLNGCDINGLLIKEADMKDVNEIVVEM